MRDMRQAVREGRTICVPKAVLLDMQLKYPAARLVPTLHPTLPFTICAAPVTTTAITITATCTYHPQAVSLARRVALRLRTDAATRGGAGLLSDADASLHVSEELWLPAHNGVSRCACNQ